MNSKSIESAFAHCFLQDKIEADIFEKDMELVRPELESILVNYQANIEKSQLKLERVNASLVSGKISFHKEISSFNEEIGFDKIEEEYLAAKAKLDEKKYSLTSEFRISILEEDRKTLEYKISSFRREKKLQIESVLRKVPVIMKTRLEKEYKDNI